TYAKKSKKASDQVLFDEVMIESMKKSSKKSSRKGSLTTEYLYVADGSAETKVTQNYSQLKHTYLEKWCSLGARWNAHIFTERLGKPSACPGTGSEKGSKLVWMSNSHLV